LDLLLKRLYVRVGEARRPTLFDGLRGEEYTGRADADRHDAGSDPTATTASVVMADASCRALAASVVPHDLSEAKVSRAAYAAVRIGEEVTNGSTMSRRRCRDRACAAQIRLRIARPDRHRRLAAGTITRAFRPGCGGGCEQVVDHQPLHRQQQKFAREGVELRARRCATG